MNKIPTIVTRRSKRLGRGYGSGKGGHTSGRGQKGQKARRNIGILFEGMKVKKSLLHRLPVLRGKDKNKAYRSKPITINIGVLNNFSDGSTVTVKSLVEAKIVEKEALIVGVKILGDGKLEKKLTVNIPVSKSASAKIEQAGGKVNVA